MRRVSRTVYREASKRDKNCTRMSKRRNVPFLFNALESGTLTGFFSFGQGGETGRRTGLKILCTLGLEPRLERCSESSITFSVSSRHV
jgi:hypothetical protein